MIRAAVARHARARVTEARYLATLRDQQRPWLIEVPQIVLARHDPAALIDGIAASLGHVDEVPRG